MGSNDDSTSGAVAAAPVPAPFAAPCVSADSTTDAASAAPTATSATNKKKFMGGFGSYLPKVPSYLLQKNGGSSSATTATTATTDEDPADELKELPDIADRRSNDSDSHLHHQPHAAQLQPQSAAAAAAAAFRRRGMSIEQNVSTLYRKMTVRQASSHSASDSSPSTSLTGSDANAPSPRSDPNLKARRGACVATTFGTGVVVDVRLDDGFYIVQLVAPKSIAYLRADTIVREIKAIVGERVKTRWGLATVEQYYVDDDMYSIALDWRWDDDHVWRMKATTKKFEKLTVKGSLMQNTKNLLFESYSTLRGSTTTGYANVVARLNTPVASAAPFKRTTQQQAVNGKALTPFGICTVLDVRSDKFFVVALPCGATGYFHVDSIKLQQRRTHFQVGDRVQTPYGSGEVTRFRDDDETYAVRLDVSHESSHAPVLFITDIHAETQLTFAAAGASANANNTRLSSILTLTRNSVFSAGATVYSAGATAGATVKASATGGLTTVKASATGGLTTLVSVKANLSTLAAVKLTKPKFIKGERVVTKMGSGFIVEFRPLDKIYEVYLRRLKFTGFFHESALTAFPYERVTHFVVDGRTIPAPEIPRHVSDVKRRQVITAAIQSAREGKLFDAVLPSGSVVAPVEAEVESKESKEVVSVEVENAAPGVL